MNAERVVNAANRIVTDHLVKRFNQEVKFFYEIVEFGDQLLVYKNDRSLGVIDVSDNKDPVSLIEKFCELYTNKNNILVEVNVEESNKVETISFTLQNGDVYHMQDFSKLYLKL